MRALTASLPAVSLLHCSVTTLLRCLAALLGCLAATLPHCYAVCCYAVSLLRCLAVTLLRCFAVWQLRFGQSMLAGVLLSCQADQGLLVSAPIDWFSNSIICCSRSISTTRGANRISMVVVTIHAAFPVDLKFHRTKTAYLRSGKGDSVGCQSLYTEFDYRRVDATLASDNGSKPVQGRNCLP